MKESHDLEHGRASAGGTAGNGHAPAAGNGNGKGAPARGFALMP